MYIVTNYGIPCFVASSKAKAIEYIEAGIDHELGYDPEEWGLFPYQMDTEIEYDSLIMYSGLPNSGECKYCGAHPHDCRNPSDCRLTN